MSIQTKPAPGRSTAPASRGFFSTPLFFGIHLAFTILLLVAVGVFVFLTATGWLHVRTATPASVRDKDKPKAKAEAKENKTGEVSGRYQIEPLDDTRQVLGETGKLGVFGARVRDAWVFRYRGGFLDCKLETDFGGKAISSGQVPEKWEPLLSHEDIKQGKPEALNKEGYIVLLGMVPTVSIDQALEPVHPHLGAMFTVGPAGPLHALIPYYHEVWRRREYRLFLSAGPPKGKTGPGFNLWTGDLLLIRSHFLHENADNDPPAHTTSGKNLEPGKEITILERQRALSTIRLKARFLTDTEVVDKANGK